MEHVLTAPVAGTVTELGVTAGQTVALDERVAVVTPETPGTAAASAPEQQEN
jgi:acetyl-CoA/propionyl-CoA carboxylase biotin carboxyl carrier protein